MLLLPTSIFVTEIQITVYSILKSLANETHPLWHSQHLTHNSHLLNIHCQNKAQKNCQYRMQSAWTRTPSSSTGLHLAEGCSIKNTLHSQGIEHQPGPRWAPDDDSGMCVVESINITSLATCAGLLADRKSHLKLVQEHSIPKHGLARWIRAFAAAAWQFDGGPLDPELTSTGGVGIFPAAPYTTVPYQPTGQEYGKAFEMGRLAGDLCEVGNSTILCWNLSGWTGAALDEEAAQRTDDLAQIVQDETCQHPGVMALMAADVNADTEHIPTLDQLVREDQWTDVGAVASRWGGRDCQPTCKACLVANESRIDLIFVNNPLLPAVRGFQVDICDEFSAHQPLQLRLDAGALQSTVDRHYKTSSASAQFEKRMLEERAKNPEQSTEETRQRILGQLHSVMDYEMDIRYNKLKFAASKGDTTALWRIITSAAEKRCL